MQTKFAKYEGAGNDFILLDLRDKSPEISSKLIARLCNRHFGIGADGLMTLSANPALDCTMRYYNADGSEGEMCGNGARCFSLFAHHLGIGGEVKRFDARDGEHSAQLLRTEELRGEIELGMTDVHSIQTGNGWWFVNTGVPHYVEFVEDLDTVDVLGRGRTIRYDTARFAQGTNVNFVQITGSGSLRIRTYERGVEAETLACGTGATAAAIVANFAFQPTVNDFRIAAKGGELGVRFRCEPATQTYTNISLSGSARRVFEGVFDTENFLIHPAPFTHENTQGDS